MGVDDLVGVAGRAYTRGRGVAQVGNHLEMVQILDSAWIILSHKLVLREALFIFFFVSRVFWAVFSSRNLEIWLL